MSKINVSSKSKSSSSSSNDVKECENKFCKSYFPSSMQNISTGMHKEFEKRFTNKTITFKIKNPKASIQKNADVCIQTPK